jgi:hypothetical protein
VIALDHAAGQVDRLVQLAQRERGAVPPQEGEADPAEHAAVQEHGVRCRRWQRPTVGPGRTTRVRCDEPRPQRLVHRPRLDHHLAPPGDQRDGSLVELVELAHHPGPLVVDEATLTCPQRPEQAVVAERIVTEIPRSSR